ncbi:glycosyltransferase family 2 protein [Patescibacteria group bacterium]|nr:glycosyltransferase family 2 protein [Patescibacteria group bacterium]
MPNENKKDIKAESLSVFFPFWNEEMNIEKVVKKAIPVAERLAKRWEIIMVDDGSSDKTLEIAKSMARSNKNLVVVRSEKNRGYGGALKEGFKKARYELVVFTDGDGQFDIAQLPRFLDKIKEADIVIGYREKRFDHPFRHFLMNLLKVWDFVFFGFYFKDIDCGFKLFKKKAVDKIMPLSSEGAMITTEILAKAKRAELKIVQVKVSHYPRHYGNQSGGNVRVIVRAILETFKLWKDLHYGRI